MSLYSLYTLRDSYIRPKHNGEEVLQFAREGVKFYRGAGTRQIRKEITKRAIWNMSEKGGLSIKRIKNQRATKRVLGRRIKNKETYRKGFGGCSPRADKGASRLRSRRSLVFRPQVCWMWYQVFYFYLIGQYSHSYAAGAAHQDHLVHTCIWTSYWFMFLYTC
jgi:hypothetical protein